MAIHGHTDKFKFAKFLEKHLSVAQPIKNESLLQGRKEELKHIERALLTPGKQVFIVGERGVGKSSLAAVAALRYKHEDNDYLSIDCGPDSSLASIIANIVYKSLKASRVYSRTENKSASFGFSFTNIFKAEGNISESAKLNNIREEISDLSDAVRVMEWLAQTHSERTVIVIDEFDRISSKEERIKFADLLKHIGDQSINVKFLFTGVAENVYELLGAHPSSSRQITTIQLPRINFNDRWSIIRKPVQDLDLVIDHELEIRISLISDGFPYYIHLITQKILWSVFDDANNVTTINETHYREALAEAINDCAMEYKRPYDLAITRPDENIEDILWSTADTEFLVRNSKELYASYQYITRKRQRKELDIATYKKYLSKIGKPEYGEIITRTEPRKDYFTYKEKMLRGYVRLQAEAHGILLYDSPASAPTPLTANATSSRTGYHAGSIPPGVAFSRKTLDSDE